MLVLSRKARQEIAIGREIVVTVLGIEGNRVKIGISAPEDVAVNRAEILFEQPGDPPAFVQETCGTC